MKNLIKISCLLVILFTMCTTSANTTDKKLDVEPAELKRMSTFLSNFIEVGLDNFDIKTIENEELIYFGVMHNYKNNFKSRFVQCTQPERQYQAAIDPKYASESVKKYFDLELKKHGDALDEVQYDGKRYYVPLADGDIVRCARVKEVYQTDSGLLRMIGEVYYEDNEGVEEITGTMEAVAKPYKYGGKNTWAIMSLRAVDKE